MEGDSAVQAIFGTMLDRMKKEGVEPGEDMLAEMESVRETYEKELDTKYAAARGFVDAIVVPEDIRSSLELAIRTTLYTDKPHLGAFVLPQ